MSKLPIDPVEVERFEERDTFDMIEAMMFSRIGSIVLGMFAGIGLIFFLSVEILGIEGIANLYYDIIN